MPGFEQQPSQAPERHAPPPQEIGQTVEVREVAEAPSKTELRKLVKKYEAKVVDTYAEEKLYGIPNAPYTRAPEGEELTVKRFEKREDAEAYARIMNELKGPPNFLRPDEKRYEIREIEDPLDIDNTVRGNS